ncbi:hypothetical protein BD560DRAFT_393727 [Blakeslea trispora]|nr:hypothetical protein BD560DRAFT_393727 [Blakeslea trispora]
MENLTYEESVWNINRLKSARNWHKLDHFQGLINRVYSIDFSKKESVQNGKDAVQEMSQGCYSKDKTTLFDGNDKFPYGEVYIYVYAPEYVELFVNMSNKLRQIQNDIANGYGAHRESTNALVNQLFDYAKNLKNKIYHQIHIYDRAKFERIFRVNWDLRP